MYSFLVFASLAAQALTSPTRTRTGKRAAVSPQPASISVVANVTDPSVTRDSCNSVKIGNRALWTCRDTEVFNTTSGQGQLPLVVNTASWTDFNSDGTPAIITDGPVGADSDGSNPILLMYGGDPTSLPAFYPVLADECPESGACSDGSRWAIWPDSPPLLTQSGSDGSATGYTWIPKAHLDGLTSLDPEPPYTLYEIQYTPTSNTNTLPNVTTVNENFWAAGQIGYGNYGGLVVNDTVYLYGQTDSPRGTALAQVPIGSVTDSSQYQYYVNGTWTYTMPGINDTAAIIANAGAGGQGAFYYSGYFDSYIWIGQQQISNEAQFYITTAPAPEGPWIEPYLLYSGADGNNGIAGGYSLLPNPALLTSEDENGIYLTWTEQFESSTYGAYITPLAYVTWE